MSVILVNGNVKNDLSFTINFLLTFTYKFTFRKNNLKVNFFSLQHSNRS